MYKKIKVEGMRSFDLLCKHVEDRNKKMEKRRGKKRKKKHIGH